MAANDNQSLIPYGDYCPDNIQLDGNQTDRMHNIFIRADGTLMGVPNAKKAVNHPQGDRLTTLFATPTTNSSFTVFGGGRDLWAWDNLKSDWTPGFKAETESKFRWQIVDFNGVIYAAREGAGLLYFDIAEHIFKPVPNAPKMRGIYPTTDFLVGYGIQDKPQMVCWSGLKDGMKWDFGKDNAGFNYITRGGNITCVIGGQNPYIFTLRQIFKMTRTGGETPWAFSLVNPNVGLYDQQDCCEINNLVIFNDTQTYYQLEAETDSLTDIGRDIVNHTWPYYNSGTKDSSVNMRAVGDVMGRRAYYVFPGKGTLIWNLEAGKWSAMSHEGLDVFIGNFYVSSYDDMDKTYASICLVPFRADEFRDVYSCSLALSKLDGIYLIDEQEEKLFAVIGSPRLSSVPAQMQAAGRTRARIDINSVRAVLDGRAANAVKYSRADWAKAKETAFAAQNKYHQSNFRLSATTFMLYARTNSFSSFRGWVINQKGGYYQ